MISCTLNGKKYSVDFITGRALREIGPATEMYDKIATASQKMERGEAIGDDISIPEATDVLVRWFCVLFQNQFTPDDVLDGYPVDSLIHDITFALVAVQRQTTEVLSEFPMKAATAKKTATKTQTKKA